MPASAGHWTLSPLKITPQTRFNIASNGKQFTALAVLTLMEGKKLKLSDDIRLFFPELYPGIKDSITIRHLLTHSSGKGMFTIFGAYRDSPGGSSNFQTRMRWP